MSLESSWDIAHEQVLTNPRVVQASRVFHPDVPDVPMTKIEFSTGECMIVTDVWDDGEYSGYIWVLYESEWTADPEGDVAVLGQGRGNELEGLAREIQSFS